MVELQRGDKKRKCEREDERGEREEMDSLSTQGLEPSFVLFPDHKQ